MNARTRDEAEQAECHVRTSADRLGPLECGLAVEAVEVFVLAREVDQAAPRWRARPRLGNRRPASTARAQRGRCRTARSVE